MEEPNKILTNFGTIQKMATDLGVNRDTISDALSGATKSTLSVVIRNVAMKYYEGIMIIK